jgi:hypothetical protein
MRTKRKREPKAGVSHGSHDPEDKMLACLNHSIPMKGKSSTYRDYIAACGRWFGLLTPAQQETVLVVIDCYAGPHRDAAKGIAAELPAAPKCPRLP